MKRPLGIPKDDACSEGLKKVERILIEAVDVKRVSSRLQVFSFFAAEELVQQIYGGEGCSGA